MSHDPYPLRPTDITSQVEDNILYHRHDHPWRLLKSGASEVGCFRLKQGTTYLKREIQFSPLVPIARARARAFVTVTEELK